MCGGMWGDGGCVLCCGVVVSCVMWVGGGGGCV